jgi:hypothetical protein
LLKLNKPYFIVRTLRFFGPTIFWRKVFTGTFLFLFFAGDSLAQRTEQGGYHLRTSGVFAGYGKREPFRHTPYYPASFGLEFFKSFRRYNPAHAPRRVYAGIYGEPMMSLVRTNQPRIQWEGGATAGIRTHCRVGAASSIYGCITSGPYFYTADVERQAPGFLFSDNFSLGFFTPLRTASPLLLHTALRFRHISNGDTRVPNNGINTIHLLVGLSRARAR